MHLLLPLLAAAIYTVSSLFFKQAYLRGAQATMAFHWSNLVGGVFFLPLLAAGSVPWGEFWRPALISGLIYLGGWSTFLAIRKGDVSLVTPLLGAKVVFVALGVVALTGKVLTAPLWISAVATTLGIFLIGLHDLRSGRGSAVAVAYSLASCLFFGASDVLLAEWAQRFGKFAFLGVVAVLIAVYSLIQVLLTNWRILILPAGARMPIVLGGLSLAGQGLMMGIALAFFNDPARVNVVYGSRGLWSLALVWFIGRWFGNDERHSSRKAMVGRVCGTLLVTGAIVLAMLGH